jgi:hypothetical protein
MVSKEAIDAQEYHLDRDSPLRDSMNAAQRPDDQGEADEEEWRDVRELNAQKCKHAPEEHGNQRLHYRFLIA